MPTILAIDAAWTKKEPSGVALVTGESSAWRCIAVAPSYGTFLQLAEGTPVPWGARTIPGEAPDPAALLSAAHRLAGQDVTLVTVDMPVSTAPITDRRTADQAISGAFGSRGCAAHSPSTARPGQVGHALCRQFADRGFALATTRTARGAAHRLVEVYPHPALLALVGSGYRVPYKVSKSLRYWPNTSVQQRIVSLLAEYQHILTALATAIQGIALSLPDSETILALSHLKRYEDALDALVCAWVGIQYLAGQAAPFGDETAAIWTPTSN